MPSTARSSRLGSSLSARVTSQLGIAFTRAGAWRHPVTSTVNREQPKKLRFMTYGFVPAVPKPVGLAPVESIRRGSASGTVPLASTIRSRRRAREDQNHESLAPDNMAPGELR